ncbi:MAG: NAD(P)/FAD-dependent oxidoreductase, partial [Bacteroidota bacterium]
SEKMNQPFARFLKRAFGKKLGFGIIRRMRILREYIFLVLARRAPKTARWLLLKGVEKELGKGFDIEKHFTPKYNPWDQRICMVPDADLFQAIKKGKADVVTDHIDRFTEKGILLKSGTELEADIIVTATGLNLKWMAQLEMTIDGRTQKPGDLVYFRGTMFDSVPNMAMVVGYTTMSWTLRANLVCEYIVRILNHMDQKGVKEVRPVMADRTQTISTFVDLNSGYFQRALDTLPKMGDRKPWIVNTNYMADYRMLKYASLEHPELHYE